MFQLSHSSVCWCVCGSFDRYTRIKTLGAIVRVQAIVRGLRIRVRRRNERFERLMAIKKAGESAAARALFGDGATASQYKNVTKKKNPPVLAKHPPHHLNGVALSQHEEAGLAKLQAKVRAQLVQQDRHKADAAAIRIQASFRGQAERRKLTAAYLAAQVCALAPSFGCTHLTRGLDRCLLLQRG